MILAFIFGVILISLFSFILKFLGFASKMIKKLVVNGLLALILLIIANKFVGIFGIKALEINWFNVIVSSIFGIPGLIILFLLN